MQTEVRATQKASVPAATPAAAPAPTPAVAPAATPVGAPRPRRRRYLVDRAAQLPITALGLLATLFFLVMFNLTLRDLTAARREQIANEAPQVATRLQAEDRALHRSIAVLSGIFFVCVGFGMVVLTQRSVGPIRRIGTHLERAARGDLEHRVSVRRRDHFQPLAASCNALLEALQRARRDDAARLERLAVAAESATSPGAARALAAELRAYARSKR